MDKGLKRIMKGRLRAAAVMMVCVMALVALPAAAHAAAPFTNEYPGAGSTITSNPGVISVDLVGVPALAAPSASITIGGVACQATVIQSGSSLGSWTNSGYTQDANGFWIAHWTWSASTASNATLWVYPPSSVLGNGSLGGEQRTG